MATASEGDVRVVRIRVFNVLKQWIEKFWYDFVKDCPELSSRVYTWLDEKIADPEVIQVGADKIASTLKAKLDAALDPRAEKKKILVSAADIPRSYPPKDATVPLLDCNSEEIARQLTMIEWKMWSAIKPYEFLNLAWTKKDRAKRSGNVIAMIERFNYVSGWVATMICMSEKPKERVRITHKFIEIAHKLYLMNNFNGLMALISGLNRGPVYRLKQTFAAVEAKDAKKIFQELQTVTSSDKSYANLRKSIRSVNPPTIPYLGMYLTDLTFIEEGNKDVVTDHRLANFHKRRLTAQTIADVQTYQNVKYQFLEIPEMLSKCFGEATFGDDELYEISEYLEPRAGKERGEKPALLAAGMPPRKEEEKGRMDLELGENPAWTPYSIPDNSSNILTNASGVIVGQTFFKTVEKLTHPVMPDTNALLPLLASLEHWTTTDQFLDALIIRFNIPSSKDKSDDALIKYKEELQAPIFLRVVNVLKSWITNHFYHFQEDPALKEKLLGFINGKLHATLPNSASSLNALIAKQTVAEAPKCTNPVPEPIIPMNTITGENAQLTDLDPHEVARQLCLISSDLFCKIKPRDMLALKDEDRPNLKAFDDNLVAIQAWALEEISTFQKLGQASLALEILGQIAYHSSVYNNWHAAFAIINAFNVTYTSQLKMDWKKVTNPIAMKFYFDHRDIFSPSQKKELGELLKNLVYPCVPIVSPYVGAIELIQKANPQDMLTPQIINIDKNKKIGEIIVRLQRLQKVTYNFVPVPAIQGYLLRSREVSQLVCGLGSNSSSTANASIFEVILNDPEFKTEIQGIVKEVLEEEISKLRAEVFNMVVTGVISVGSPSASSIADEKARDAVARAFPNSTFHSWTTPVDALLPNQLTFNVIHSEEGHLAHFLLEIKEKVVLSDIATLIKAGHLYKTQHPTIPLSSVLVVNSISEQAYTVAERCKIRVIRV
eukprot:TRINITY_DN10185_c0_g1_i1.p1 TRINITY_DN10185_c0_g1~~TRINITY_DN10185_c0_g1_i1.p1  ORF type:complete len:1047 (-),score=228.31 TRINITY_DN10185_c0_g1_i1:56-2896(-)